MLFDAKFKKNNGFFKFCFWKISFSASENQRFFEKKNQKISYLGPIMLDLEIHAMLEPKSKKTKVFTKKKQKISYLRPIMLKFKFQKSAPT